MPGHKFLSDRSVKELFIVCRIDDYSTCQHPGTHGGYAPTQAYGNKGGYLWPTLKQANDAARHIIGKFPDQQYGVFRLTTICERTAPILPPISVTVVG